MTADVSTLPEQTCRRPGSHTILECALATGVGGN